ncbi:MAG: zinc-ribbon domain-containing protein [Candidatus Heimdallarchaeaceae archaeon]
MNLEQVKGVIEIAGVKFSAAQLIESLVDQGFSVSFNNGNLRIGQRFLKPELFIDEEYKTCPIIDICKKYDEIIKDAKRKIQFPQYINNKELIEKSACRSKNFNQGTIIKDEIYEDNINLDDEIFDYPSLKKSSFGFSDKEQEASPLTYEQGKTFTEPREMIGVGTLTFGRPLSSNGTTCSKCGAIVNEGWQYCGKCGSYIER